MRRHIAQSPYREASSQCGRWPCGEENSSCQLQPAEEEKINKAKLPLNGKNRNKTKNPGHAERALLIFLLEDTPNAESHDHRCTIGTDYIRVLKRSSEESIIFSFPSISCHKFASLSYPHSNPQINSSSNL